MVLDNQLIIILIIPRLRLAQTYMLFGANERVPSAAE